jgi:hypothetical protein
VLPHSDPEFVLCAGHGNILPLSPPTDGWQSSSGWIVRNVFDFSLVALSCLQQTCSCFLTGLDVTLGHALAITWICVSYYFIVLLALMAVWVFPIPFVFVLTGGIFCVASLSSRDVRVIRE